MFKISSAKEKNPLKMKDNNVILDALIAALNMDWNPKMGSPVAISSASLQTSVISTSVLSGGTMVTNPGGDSRVMDLNNQSPGQPDDMGDQGFPHYSQVCIWFALSFIFQWCAV